MIFSTRIVPGFLAIASAPLAATLTVTPAHADLTEGSPGQDFQANRPDQTDPPDCDWSLWDTLKGEEAPGGMLQPGTTPGSIRVSPLGATAGTRYELRATARGDSTAVGLARIHVIRATETKALPAPKLQGRFLGRTSHVGTGEASEWDLELESDGRNISGTGATLFRGQPVPFMVFGAYDTVTGKGNLCKIHTGEFDNAIEYEIKGSPDGSFTLSGDYSSGKLQPVGPALGTTEKNHAETGMD